MADLIATERSNIVAIADEVKIMQNISGGITIGDMVNSIKDANNEVDEQTDLIAQIKEALEMIEMINFTINGVGYQIKEGTTWGEWIDNNSNIVNTFSCQFCGALFTGEYSDEHAMFLHMNGGCLIKLRKAYEISYVMSTDTIVSGDYVFETYLCAN